MYLANDVNIIITIDVFRYIAINESYRIYKVLLVSRTGYNNRHSFFFINYRDVYFDFKVYNKF